MTTKDPKVVDKFMKRYNKKSENFNAVLEAESSKECNEMNMSKIYDAIIHYHDYVKELLDINEKKDRYIETEFLFLVEEPIYENDDLVILYKHIFYYPSIVKCLGIEDTNKKNMEQKIYIIKKLSNTKYKNIDDWNTNYPIICNNFLKYIFKNLNNPYFVQEFTGSRELLGYDQREKYEYYRGTEYSPPTKNLINFMKMFKLICEMNIENDEWFENFKTTYLKPDYYTALNLINENYNNDDRIKEVINTSFTEIKETIIENNRKIREEKEFKKKEEDRKKQEEKEFKKKEEDIVFKYTSELKGIKSIHQIEYDIKNQIEELYGTEYEIPNYTIRLVKNNVNYNSEYHETKEETNMINGYRSQLNELESKKEIEDNIKKEIDQLYESKSNVPEYKIKLVKKVFINNNYVEEESTFDYQNFNDYGRGGKRRPNKSRKNKRTRHLIKKKGNRKTTRKQVRRKHKTRRRQH